MVVTGPSASLAASLDTGVAGEQASSDAALVVTAGELTVSANGEASAAGQDPVSVVDLALSIDAQGEDPVVSAAVTALSAAGASEDATAAASASTGATATAPDLVATAGDLAVGANGEASASGHNPTTVADLALTIGAQGHDPVVSAAVTALSAAGAGEHGSAAVSADTDATATGPDLIVLAQTESFVDDDPPVAFSMTILEATDSVVLNAFQGLTADFGVFG